ncbi:polyprenyl synthetase family protein [Micromonospora zingiberis]|nr:polyprenyl synthetase family protein [Micromonospora zingiberis]
MSTLVPPTPIEYRERIGALTGPETLSRFLAELEVTVVTAVGPEVPVVAKATTDVLAGGKRLRPMLTLAAATAAGPEEVLATAGRRLIDLGTAVELLHAGSLVHDDVMDGAETRHGAPSVNAAQGTGTAILCGDYLIALSFSRAASVGVAEVATIAAAFTELCRGQAAETRDLFRPERTVADYYSCIEGKTAALFAASCRLGVLAAGGEQRVARKLADFGLALGMAFQIVDDLLDLGGLASTIGKPTGQDLTAGVYTLPTLLALADRPEIGDALRAGDTTTVTRMVLDSSAPEQTVAAARKWTGRAVEVLHECAESLHPGTVDALGGMAVSLLGRAR